MKKKKGKLKDMDKLIDNKNQTFSPFEDENNLSIYEYSQTFDSSQIVLKIKELTTGEDDAVTRRAMVVKGKGRKRIHDLDTGVLKIERIYYSTIKPSTGLFINGDKIELSRDNIGRLKSKLSDWIYEKILDLNEVTEEDEKN